MIIERHKTAIRRNRLSRPVALLLELGLLNQNQSFFDYGCGHGQDIELLEKNGFNQISGWDPFFKIESEKTHSDVVNLGYVLNVIEKPQERQQALINAYNLAGKILCVSVLTQHQKAYEGVEFEDGVLSKAGTFQKFFDQLEIKNYIETTLNKDAIALGPGIFLVFKTEQEKLTFLQSRYKRPVFLEVTQLDPITREPRKIRVFKPKLETLIKESPFFNEVINFIFDHGRLPFPEESEAFQNLISEFKSKRKIENLIYDNIDEEAFLDIRSLRIEELLVFFALRRFDRNGIPKQADLPSSLALDIKSFFSSYREFTKKAEALLFSLGNEKLMRSAHQHITIGKVLPDAVYIHPRYISCLPAPIQVKVGVAEKLIGTIEGCNLIKINKLKEKVSFMVYEDFDTVAHPALLYTYVVDLPKLSIKLWDFEPRENPPILHRKEAFIGEDFPSYEKFKNLTQTEEEAGLLSHNFIGTRREWEDFLEVKGFEIKGHELIKKPL